MSKRVKIVLPPSDRGYTLIGEIVEETANREKPLAVVYFSDSPEGWAKISYEADPVPTVTYTYIKPNEE